MNYWDFIYNGPAFAGGRFQRAQYPKDEIKAEGQSTYKYQGRITSQFYKDRIHIRVIDGVAHVYSVSPQLRQEAIAKLGNMQTASNVQGTVSGLGCAVSVYKAICGAANGGLWGIAAAALGIVATSSFYRGYQASDEAEKWEDPAPKAIDSRRSGGESFRVLESNDWRGKLFTQDETAHIFHRSIKRQEKQFETASTSGRPELVDAFYHEFILRTSPFLQRSLKYAYPDLHRKTQLYNPKKPQDGHWHTEDLMGACDKFMGISQSYIQWKAKKQDDQDRILQNRMAASVATGAVENIASDVIKRNAENSLTRQKAVRDQRLREAHANFMGNRMTYHQYTLLERQIKEEYENHPDVKKVEEQARSNKATVETLSALAQLGIDAAASIQEQRQSAAAKQRLREEMGRNIADLFKFYRDQRKHPNPPKA